jgi:hypothetical protein
MNWLWLFGALYLAATAIGHEVYGFMRGHRANTLIIALLSWLAAAWMFTNWLQGLT